MRQIKFRAWDDINKKWLLGYDMPNLGSFSMKGEVMAMGEFANMLGSFKIEDWDKIIIEQFTGLKDKNGVDIYEGDILATGHLDFKCAVTFEDGCFQLKSNKEQGSSPLVQDRAKRLEFIGNIHDNPELL